MKKIVRKLKEAAPISELELMSIHQAAKVVHLNRGEIQNAMDKFVQSGGRDGLAFISKGSRRLIRAGALKSWLISLEKKAIAA